MPIWHQSPKLTPRYFLETPRLFGYPFGEGLNLQPNHLYTAYRSAVNFQPDHLYTTYRSVVNLLCTNILPSTKRKVNRTIH